MIVDHSKFKPHNEVEENFLKEMTERVTALVAKHNLKVNHLRFGRQVKAYGSRGVAKYHTYTYYSDPNKVEFWINAYNTKMDEKGMRELEWALVLGNFQFLSEEEQSKHYDDQDIVAFNLATGRNLRPSKRNRKWMAARTYADSVLSFGYKNDIDD